MRKAIVQEDRKDPFAGYAGVPMFSAVSGQQRYLGRVVIEIWQGSSRSMTEGSGLAFLIDPGTSDVAGQKLLELVRDGIGARLAQQGTDASG